MRPQVMEQSEHNLYGRIYTGRVASKAQWIEEVTFRKLRRHLTEGRKP